MRLNASGLVYGVLAVAAVVAAEATRRETYPKVLGASALTMALYWLAHSYASHLGGRFHTEGRATPRLLLATVAHEAFMLAGAAGPVAVLLIAWAVGASLETGVTATLWAAGVELVALELVTGIRRRLAIKDMAAETLIGVMLGTGILGIRLLLH